MRCPSTAHVPRERGARVCFLLMWSVATASHIPLISPVGPLECVWDSPTAYQTPTGICPHLKSKPRLPGGIFSVAACAPVAAMSAVRAVVVFATTATALLAARKPLRSSTAAYTATVGGEIYADAPSGLFGARSSIEPYLALEIPVVDEKARPSASTSRCGGRAASRRSWTPRARRSRRTGSTVYRRGRSRMC